MLKMWLFSKAQKISCPRFAQTFPDPGVILDLGLPISVQSEISPSPPSFLLALDLSKSILNIPSGSWFCHLHTSAAHMPNNINASTKVDEIVTKKLHSMKLKKTLSKLSSAGVTALLQFFLLCHCLSKPTHTQNKGFCQLCVSLYWVCHEKEEK